MIIFYQQLKTKSSVPSNFVTYFKPLSSPPRRRSNTFISIILLKGLLIIKQKTHALLVSIFHYCSNDAGGDDRMIQVSFGIILSHHADAPMFPIELLHD